MLCTGGNLPLLRAPTLTPSTTFSQAGVVLGGTIPSWAQMGRWAATHFDAGFKGRKFASFVLFSADIMPDDGKHKHEIGWVLSNDRRDGAREWKSYAPGVLDLGQAPGGEIDPSIFRDDNGRTYLLWKSDDNNAGSTVTYLWIQRVELTSTNLRLLGQKRLLIDSNGLWWVDSFIPGGTLVEGPEMVKVNGWYYLFFAAGKYCQQSYSQGVARSQNIFGPYEKLNVPLLSSNFVGRADDSAKTPIVGPGHAGFLKDDSGDWYLVYHGTLNIDDSSCHRRAFVAKMIFSEATGWPYVEIAVSWR